MSLWIFIAGYGIFIVGLSIGAHLLNVPLQWIGAGALCLAGLAVVHGVSSMRHRDPVQ